MHEHFPILDTNRPIPEVADTIPFLFWTIVVVNCRYHYKHYTLLRRLRPHYQPLLGKALATSPASLYTIQTLLVLCYWPLPCNKQPHDPSWHIYDVAINAALFLGLHTSAEQRALRLNEHASEVRSKIWLGCLYISTLYVLACHHYLRRLLSDNMSRLSRTLGLPSLGAETLSLTSETSIRRLALTHPDFAKVLEIQRHVARYLSITGRDPEAKQCNIAALRMVESDLNLILASGWPQDCEVDLCRAKLGLYGLLA